MYLMMRSLLIFRIEVPQHMPLNGGFYEFQVLYLLLCKPIFTWRRTYSALETAATALEKPS